MQNVCDKTNTAKKCEEYAMRYMHCLVWDIVLKITNEVVKKLNAEKF